jgi:hypothetical protein
MRYLRSFNESSTGTDVDYYKAAIHYFNNNLNNDRALEYINKAIELSLSDRKVINPYYLTLKKMIEEKGPETKFDSNEQQMEALQDLCDTNLAYLKDENFIVIIVQSRPDSFYIFIGLDGFNSSGIRDYFSWSSVKDHLIPFFHYLSKDFKIQDTAKGHNPRGISFLSYDSTGTVNEHINVDEILNDEIADDKQVVGLSIYVKSEYFI